jgi:hypothetical protein
MSNQITLEGPQISSPKQLLQVVNEKLPLSNNDVAVVVMSTEGIFGTSHIKHVYIMDYVDDQTATDFYVRVAVDIADEESYGIALVRGRDRNYVDSDLAEKFFNEHGHFVLDILQVDWTEKTWASDMCKDASCCDQSMTQSFLEEEI